MYWITLAQATHPDSGHLKNISQNTLCPESHEPLLFSLLHKLLAAKVVLSAQAASLMRGVMMELRPVGSPQAPGTAKCMLLSHLGGIWKRCNPRRGTGSLGMCIRC